jgi:hypothetical protein
MDHAVCAGEKCIQHFGQKTKGRDNFEDIGINGRTVLEWVLEKYGGKLWIAFI